VGYEMRGDFQTKVVYEILEEGFERGQDWLVWLLYERSKLQERRKKNEKRKAEGR